MSDKPPAMEPIIGDAFGLALLDHLDHGPEARPHFVEREDGLLQQFDTATYFTGKSILFETEPDLTQRSGERVLDVGAGAGRQALPVQQSGRQVVALDTSPGATEVCRRRGMKETYTGTVFDLADEEPEAFDTILLLGNNLGLLESVEHAPLFLDALARLSRPGTEIIGTGLDPFDTEDPLHLQYHQLNRDRGRLPGQLRLRTRWGNVATPWFDYLLQPINDLQTIADKSGWELIDHQPGHPYVAVLARR